MSDICTATTKAGRPCRATAMWKKDTCASHTPEVIAGKAGRRPPAGVEVKDHRCGGTTKQGRSCRAYARDGWCDVHNPLHLARKVERRAEAVVSKEDIASLFEGLDDFLGIEPDPMPPWQLERVGMKEISRLQLAWAARFGDESSLGRLYANQAEKRLVDLFNKDNGGAK